MDLHDYDVYCGSLPHATCVVQWGGAHVWKVGGKVFAVCWDEGAAGLHVTFKCSPVSYDLLKELPGCRPAPYLASRGMKWIQRTSPESLDDDGLRAYIAESHRLVVAGLPKRVQKELGLTPCSACAGRAASPARGSSRAGPRSRRSRPERD